MGYWSSSIETSTSINISFYLFHNEVKAIVIVIVRKTQTLICIPNEVQGSQLMTVLLLLLGDV